MPPEEGVNWEGIIESGLQAAAVSFGTAFGGPIGIALADMIVSSLFQNGSENKFGDAIKNLKEFVQGAIDNAFLQNTTAHIVGLGQNLRTYFATKDQAILPLLQNDITQNISALLGEQYKNSDEALTTLVYAVNVYILTLRAQADYNPTYYNVIKDTVTTYAQEVEEFANRIETKYTHDLDRVSRTDIEEPKDSSLSDRIVNAICGQEPGFAFRYKAYFYADYVPFREFYEDRCETFPFRSKDGHTIIHDYDDLGSRTGSGVISLADLQGSKAFADCEAFRLEKKNGIITGLNNFLAPTRNAVNLWRSDIIRAIESH